MTEKLARASGRHPWLVVGLWLLVILGAFVLVATFLEFEGEAEITRQTESQQAEQIVSEGFPDLGAMGQAITEVVVVRAENGDVEAAPTRARVAALADELRAAGASRVVTYGEEPRLVSQDRDSTVLLVGLGRDGEGDVEGVVEAVERLDDEAGYAAAVTGGWTSDADEEAASLEDLKKGELFFGAPVALVILLLVFGAVVAGLVPLMLAIVSIAVALALVALVAQAYDLSVFTQNMLIGMGLALGIDYSLFILSRYREERLGGREKLDAIETAGATAGRAVLFSGIAFVLAMLGLLLVPSTIFRSLAAGAILVGDRLRDRSVDAPSRRSRSARRPRELASHTFLRTRRRAGGPGGARLGGNRPLGDAPPRLERRSRRRPAARARRPRAHTRHRHLRAGDAARPLRVEAGLSPPQRGVPEGDDRPSRDRRRRKGRHTRDQGGVGPARERACEQTDLRRADRRGKPGRHGRARHGSDRRRPERHAGDRGRARAAQ